MTEEAKVGAEIAVIQEEPHAIQLLLDLERVGSLDEVSLDLGEVILRIPDPKLQYARWEDVGRFLGSLDRRVRWYLGDWLNFGEELFGEEHAQAVETTPAERYDLALRCTSLDKQTLMNVSSICRRVARTRRRRELGFWIHSEVAALEPADQVRWLQRAIDEGWHRAELRDAIRAEKNPAAEDAAEDDDRWTGDDVRLTVAQRIEAAARIVYQMWQATSDGSFLVPPEAAAQLMAALGEEH